jgi:muramoyltetrapeptide carboxypeptidase
MIFPSPLEPGDRIAVVAPSGPFDPELLARGLVRLSDYELAGVEKLEKRPQGFFAASDDERLADLQSALDCPDARAIWIARGGYGIARLLPNLSFERFLDSPKWVVGFSDVTALHHRLQRLGIASLHASNGTSLASIDSEDEGLLRRALHGDFEASYDSLEVLREGYHEGTLWGGNLTVLFSEAVAGRLHLPQGTVLFLEDVTETSYRVDRMLDSLIAGRHLDRLGAVVLGSFTDCSPGKFNVPVTAVLRDNLRALGIPVLSGLPSGHGARNAPLPLGGRAIVDSSSPSLKITQF